MGAPPARISEVAKALVERGYDVTVTTIDKKITPMNTILIGIPN